MSYPNIIEQHNTDIETIKSTYLPLSGGTVKSLHCNSPLVINAQNTSVEGGELVLEYPSEEYPYKSRIDNYKGTTRIFNENGTQLVVDHINNKVFTNGNFCHSDTTSRVFFCGGTYTEDGSHLEVTGKDCTGDFGLGGFSLRAKDGTNTSSLDGWPSGGLYWRGKPVVCRENYTGQPTYIKFDNGLIIQWGYTYISANTTTITFPIAFTYGVHSITVTPTYPGVNANGDNNMTVQVNGWTNTTFNPSFWDSDTTTSRTGYIFWTAFGY